MGRKLIGRPCTNPILPYGLKRIFSWSGVLKGASDFFLRQAWQFGEAHARVQTTIWPEKPAAGEAVFRYRGGPQADFLADLTPWIIWIRLGGMRYKRKPK
jgi:hypothetical protein